MSCGSIFNGHHQEENVGKSMTRKNMDNNLMFNDGVSVSGEICGYAYVDLGLKSGLKWATCNVGASKPTEFGDYFAWGETCPKNDYSWKTYKWCLDSHKTQSKYCTSRKYGDVDNKAVLDEEDDVATVKWGKEWRMPSIAELTELYKNCIWEFVQDFNGSGVAGLFGTSKKNERTIFFPAAGYRCLTHFGKVGEYSYIWSSSLDKKYPDGGYSLGFWELGGNLKGDYRLYGQSVRAVVRPNMNF